LDTRQPEIVANSSELSDDSEVGLPRDFQAAAARETQDNRDKLVMLSDAT
jgi:hypothetical protein